MDVTPSTVTCSRCRTEYPGDALFCPMCGAAKARDYSGDPLVGSVIAERYLVQDRLGHGASGTIYRGEHVTLHRRVAIKVLHHELSRDDLAIERFRRAATTVSEIDNDHIVSIHDFGRIADGRLYVAMELLDGRTLADVLEDGPLPVEKTVDILVQLGEALMEAHAVGYIHRDLRPRNIFLAQRRGKMDYVKILDFGLAKLVEKEGEAASTSLGMTFGDPRYMSPEQAKGDPVDRRTDIYSLGCIAYEMIVGDPPFVAPKVFDVLTQHLEAPPVQPVERRPDIPAWLNAAIMTALSKRRDERFVTVYRFIEALRQGSQTGEVMTAERARRLETEPPPSVKSTLRKLGTPVLGAAPPPSRPPSQPPGAADPSATVQGVAPVHPSGGVVAAPAAPHDTERDDAMDLRATVPAGKHNRTRSESSAGISAAWYADGEALGNDAEAAGAGDSAALRRLQDRARASRTGIISYDDYAEGEDSRRKLMLVIGGVAATLVLLVGVLWATGGKDGDSAAAAPAIDAAPAPVVDPAPVVAETPDAAPLQAAAPPDAAPVKPPVVEKEPPPPRPVVRKDRDPAPPPPKKDKDPPPPPDPDPKPTGDAAQADFFAKLGQRDLRNGDVLGAAGNFKKALELDPRNATAIAGLGEIALSQGHYQDAIAHLKQATRLAPRNARMHTLLGEAYLGSGNSKLAAAAFKKALRLDPDDRQARNGYNEAIGRTPDLDDPGDELE